MRPRLLLTRFLLPLGLVAPVCALSFSYSRPTACSPFSVSWQDGLPPFQILIAPAFGVPQNITVPAQDSLVSSSFNTTLNLDPGTKFLLVLSDATGFASGGVSPVLDVAAPSSISTSNLTCQQEVPPFTFQADLSLKQCSDFVFNGYRDAVLPLRMIGLIPQGDAIVLETSNASQLTWPVNVATGTTILFIAVDADNRSGGATDLLDVLASNNNSCINPSSPSSTAIFTPGPSSTPAPTPQGADISFDSRHGAIVGGAVSGAVFGTLLFAVLLYVYYKYRKLQRNNQDDGSTTASFSIPHRRDTTTRMRQRNNIRLVPDGQPITPMQDVLPLGNLEPNPFFLPRANSSHSSSMEDELSPMSPVTHSRRISKAGLAMRTSALTPRLVLHTDLESQEDMSQEAEVVELPPLYKSTRKSLNMSSPD